MDLINRNLSHPSTRFIYFSAVRRSGLADQKQARMCCETFHGRTVAINDQLMNLSINRKTKDSEVSLKDKRCKSVTTVNRIKGNTKSSDATGANLNVLEQPFQQPKFPEVTFSSRQKEEQNTGKKKYLCTSCQYSTNLYGNLNKHQLSHSSNKPFPCPECNKAFTQSSSLKRHQLSHSGKKPYQCPDCNKAFTQSTNMKRHQLIHSGKKPYPCLECDKIFRHSSTLKRHQLIHNGKKPYPCPECDKVFRFSSNLQRHRLTHSGKRPCSESSS